MGKQSWVQPRILWAMSTLIVNALERKANLIIRSWSWPRVSFLGASDQSLYLDRTAFTFWILPPLPPAQSAHLVFLTHLLFFMLSSHTQPTVSVSHLIFILHSSIPTRFLFGDIVQGWWCYRAKAVVWSVFYPSRTTVYVFHSNHKYFVEYEPQNNKVH